MDNNKNERNGDTMNVIKYLAYALVIIGAINWGLVGLFEFDLVAAVFGEMSILSRIIYSLVGISGIVTALTMHQCEPLVKRECDEYGRCNF